MFKCPQCGKTNSQEDIYCSACGHTLNKDSTEATKVQMQTRVGYSTRINDPAFSLYVRKSNRWAVIFALILAVIAFVGFTISGATGGEPGNPQSMYIGIGIGGMFLAIAFFQISGRKRSVTWDGIVVEKEKENKRRRTKGSDGFEYYMEFRVVVQRDNGKIYKMIAENDDTVYNYYNIGDKVRHHAGLNSYEKYDKSNDSIIFCNACASLNDIEDEYCFRCHCPLLK